MRICRYEFQGGAGVGFYDEKLITPIDGALLSVFAAATGESPPTPDSINLLDYLPPQGKHFSIAGRLSSWIGDQPSADLTRLPTEQVKLLKPIPRPNKLFLLAGNYAKHIEEGGGVAAERAETFPYVFMKPPTTTLIDPQQPVMIPRVSPQHIDWELELGVIIGKGGKHIAEAEALSHVAGYTVINDISNRRFRPNPRRKQRDKDSYFDWLHGKWHDSFCPSGPCVASADAIADPQQLKMQLKVNGKLKQDASTAQQIFPVAAVIEFISNIVTLEPGDMISTGTPAGVGAATDDFLKPGDRIEASISSIGVLSSPVEAEQAD